VFLRLLFANVERPSLTEVRDYSKRCCAARGL